jgi:microcystin-dependent protein
MAGTRRLRAHFFTLVGDSPINGFYTRLRGGGVSKPTQQTFEDLAESCAFHSEVNSAAAVDTTGALINKQGLVIISAGANNKSGSDTALGATGGALAVPPSGLPTLEAINQTVGDFTGDTPIEIATGVSTARNQYIVKLKASFITFLSKYTPSMTGSTGKYLKSDGTNANWDAIDISTSDISGVVPIANGGTAASTRNAAANNILPSQTSNSGKYLKTDGTDATWQDGLNLPAQSGSTSGKVLQSTGVVGSEIWAAITSIIPTGLILSFGGNSAPTGWANCDGSSYGINNATYQGLFDLIGVAYGTDAGTACTLDSSSDTFTAAAHGLVVGNRITFSAAVMPTGMTAAAIYYIVSATTNNFQVSATLGGSVVNASSNGTTVVFNTTFKVPDTRGKVMVGKGAITDASGTYTYVLGDTGGISKHQLIGDELPVTAPWTLANAGAVAIDAVGVDESSDGGTGNKGFDSVNIGPIAINTNPSGGDYHENRQPFVVANKIIKL